MKYSKKDVLKTMEELKKKAKEKRQKKIDGVEEDDTPEILRRRNSTGTRYKSHQLALAQSKGNRKSTYEKNLEKRDNQC